MADFLDFDSLEMNVDEQVNGAKEHPLKGMKTGAKMAYVGGLLFACHADDNTLQKEERSLVMGVAHSLGIGKEEVDELAEMVVGLTDKIGYLKEIVATLKDRKTILFFLCDMIKAMGADGELNENAQKLIGAVEKLAQLSEMDVVIVSSYQKILLGNASGADSALNVGDVTKKGVDKDLMLWFAPQMANVKGENKAKKEKKTKKTPAEKSTSVKKSDRNATDASASSESAVKPREPEASVSVAVVAQHFDFEELLDSTMKRFVGDYQEKSSGFSPVIFYADSAPIKKQMNAMGSMGIRETHFLFQFDNTSFGGAKEGVVITSEAFYFKNIMEDPVRIPWKSMPDDSWVSGTDMYVGGKKVDLNWMGSETAEAFAQVLNGLVKQLKAGVNVLGKV